MLSGDVDNAGKSRRWGVRGHQSGREAKERLGLPPWEVKLAASDVMVAAGDYMAALIRKGEGRRKWGLTSIEKRGGKMITTGLGENVCVCVCGGGKLLPRSSPPHV